MSVCLRCTDSPREGYARRLSRALNVAKKMQVAIEEERPRISGAAFLPNQVFEKRSICSFLFDKTTRSIVILIVLVLCLGIVMLAAPNNVPANVIGGCFTLSGCYLVRRLLRHIRCYCKTPAVVLQLDSEGARYFKPSGTIDIPWTSIAAVLVREEHPWYGCTYIGVVELTFFQTTGLTRGMEFHSHGWEVQGGLAPVLAALMDHAPDPTVQPKFISGTSHKLEYCGGICRIEASRVVVKGCKRVPMAPQCGGSCGFRNWGARGGGAHGGVGVGDAEDGCDGSGVHSGGGECDCASVNGGAGRRFDDGLECLKGARANV